MSALSITLCNENEAVGPCGRCEIVIAVGVPRCSCSSITSVRSADFAEYTRFGRMRLPRFRRMDVGSKSLISFAKEDSRDEGSLDVVTKIRGSLTPLSLA